MSLDIKKDSMIDHYALEAEAKRLPSTISKYHEAINEQTRVVDNLKFRLEKEEAVARQDARKVLAKDGTKPTQSMIDDAVTCLPAIIQLRKEVSEEERDLAYLKGCISILDTKRKSIDNLVSLFIHSFYTENAIDKGVSDGRYVQGDVSRRNLTKQEYDSEIIQIKHS